VRWAAPVLVFTAEEVWATRYPEGGSVHLLEWPVLPGGEDAALIAKWEHLRELRRHVTEAIEPLRRDKQIGSGLAAEIDLIVADPAWIAAIEGVDLAELFISGGVQVASGRVEGAPVQIIVRPTLDDKCGRCWRHLPEVEADGALCSRCDQVVDAMDALA